ncbi:MAG: SdpI family protein [Clostridia bacterium]|nr:SdpI family protein [Clostridia bacterium]
MKTNLSVLWHKYKMLLIITSCIILLQTLVGVMLWDQLPEQIATHFNMNNQPDGWSSKAFTVFGMPLILLALHWLCLVISCAPNQQKVYSRKMRYVMLFIIPAVTLLMMVVCYGHALGAAFHVGRVVLPFTGAILAVSGNYMPKVRRNPTVGIRLPWTLMDDENWYKTHRFAAPVWVVGGLLLIVLGLIGYTSWPVMAVIFAIILLPMVYSLALYLKKQYE